MKKLTVIIPVYNKEKYIKDCIDSVINQSFKDYNLILVDDGSKDNSLEICREYAQKYDFIKVFSQENGGQSVARNTGLDNMEPTEYVGFIDGDDFIHRDMYKVLVESCDKTGADVGRIYPIEAKPEEVDINSDLEDYSPYVIDRKETFINDYIKLMKGNNLGESLVGRLYRYELIKDIRFHPYFRNNQDYIFNAHVITKLNSVCHIKKNLYFIRLNEESTTHDESKQKHYLTDSCLERNNILLENNMEYSHIFTCNIFFDCVRHFVNMLQKGRYSNHTIKEYREKILKYYEKSDIFTNNYCKFLYLLLKNNNDFLLKIFGSSSFYSLYKRYRRKTFSK